MGTLCETFLAEFALIGFLFCMNHNMHFQLMACTKILTTDMALVPVFFDVFFQTTLKHKAFVTITALEWFFFGVKSHVVLQIRNFHKTLLTVHAQIRPVCIMYSCNMPPETSVSEKTFLTVLALIGFLISMGCGHMIFQMHSLCEASVTMLATVGFFFGVCLNMLLKLVLSRESILTPVTLVQFHFGMLFLPFWHAMG